MKLTAKIIVMSVLGSAEISCAATPEREAPRKDAVLLNADNSKVREAIRVFVRQHSGRFVIADLDTLTQSPVLVLRKRATDYESQIRKLPTANLNYRLVSHGSQCWLVLQPPSSDTPITTQLLLPDIARCAVYFEPVYFEK